MIKLNPFNFKYNTRYKLICYLLTGVALILDTFYTDLSGNKLLINSYIINGYVVGVLIIIYALWNNRKKSAD